MKYRHHALCSAALLACTASAWAQAATAVQAPEQRENIAMTLPDAASHMFMEVSDGGPGRPERRVSGAPYCADAVSESIQPLMDGNRIVKKTTTKFCRDGEGRTRQESDVNGNPRVYINDPVAKKHWILDVKNKTAMQLQGGEGLAGNPLAAGQWQAYGDLMRNWAEKFSERVKIQAGEARGEARAAAQEARAAAMAAAAAEKDANGNPRPVVITEVRREVRNNKDGAPTGEPKVEREIRMYTINKDGERVALATPPAAPAAPGAPATPPVPPVPPMPPLPALDALPAMPAMMQFGNGNNVIRIVSNRGPGTTTSLGSKDIEGVKANGERTTWTIEAGKLGNEKPIVITSEKWTSPDLMLTVSSREVDPRTGENSYKLSNIKRGEPDAALFKLPSDYKVNESALREKTVRIIKRAPASAPQ